jgi:hypothetical protein
MVNDAIFFLYFGECLGCKFAHVWFAEYGIFLFDFFAFFLSFFLSRGEKEGKERSEI